MKSLARKKEFLLGFLLVLTSVFLFSYFQKKDGRNPAQISSAEIRYAETLFAEDSKQQIDDELIVAPRWEDPLNEEEEENLDFENTIESQIIENYEKKLLQEWEKKKLHDKEMKLQKEKKEYAEEFLRRAREDGYELVIDEDLNVIEVQEIPKKVKPIYQIPFNKK